jgi:transcriptional regulator with XRE-family HTH domain
MLGDRLKQAIKNAGISYAKAAAEMGISEGSLYNIFKKDSFEVSYLLKAAELVGLPASHFLEDGNQKTLPSQTGDFNQAGNSNTQKVKVDKGQPQQDLAAALAACQRELEVTRALVAAKDETITLLRASYTRPN